MTHYTTETLRRFWDACKAVNQAAIDRPGNSNLQYAASYARAGLKMTGIEEIQTQALYIYADCNYWRGKESQETKKVLKEFMK